MQIFVINLKLLVDLRDIILCYLIFGRQNSPFAATEIGTYKEVLQSQVSMSEGIRSLFPRNIIEADK